MTTYGAHRDADAGYGGPEVLIVGMGPTGVTLAGLLGQRGIRTAVFDQLSGLYPLPRAAGMDHEVMRAAQELQVAQRLEPHVVPYRASQYRGVHNEVIKRLDSPPPPYRLGWEPMFAFDQPAFETVLRERVAELPSVAVSTDTEVVSMGQDEGGVWADVCRNGDEVERVRGSYLVACDGGSSQVRRDLGIAMTDLGFHENWLVIDAIIEDEEVLSRLPDTQVQYCQPDRPATFINLVGRHRRWEIALEPDELPVGAVANDDVWPWLERWVRPGEARIWRAAAYTFHGLVAERWRDDRILLAGDAAHMTPPFMAQGMAQGIRDVQNLAWKLHAVVEGRAKDRLLDTYQAERRPHVITTTRHTIELGRIICERDKQTALARDNELLAEHGGDVPVTYRSTFLPTLADGLLAAHTPCAGEIMPQPFVHVGDSVTRLDDVIGAGFRIIIGPSISASNAGRLQQEMRRLRGCVVRILPPGSADETKSDVLTVVERDGLITTWLNDMQRVLAVVRPDHYVYGTATTADEGLALLRVLLEECDTEPDALTSSC